MEDRERAVRCARARGRLVPERGRAEPAGLRHVEHDAVRSGPLHLDIALGVRADAERLLDVMTAARSGFGEPLRDRLEALDLKADVVDAGEALAALDAGRRVVLEVEDGEVDVPVREEDTARAGIVHLADFLHTERLDVEPGGLLDVLGRQRDVLDLRHWSPSTRAGCAATRALPRLDKSNSWALSRPAT